MKLLSIDPGASGGIAWTDGTETHCSPMPTTLGDLVAQLRSLSADGYSRCCLEQVVGFIPGGGAGAMFKFGQSFGQIQGCLQAMSFSVTEVRPMKWQKFLSCGDKKSHGKAWKSHLKGIAQSMFPACDVTLKTADALLILRYATQNEL